MADRFFFRKTERLTGKIQIEKLFQEGTSIKVFPFRVVLLLSGDDESTFPARMMISVPKGRFRRAVIRNLLKRRIREAYRRNKNPFYDQLAALDKNIMMAIVYTDNKVMDYGIIEEKIRTALQKVIGYLKQNQA